MRAYFFCLFICFPLLTSMSVRAGVMEGLSRGAYLIGSGGETCGVSNENKANEAVARVAKICADSLPKGQDGLVEAKARLEQLSKGSETSAHEKTFLLMGALHSAELSCLANSAKDLLALPEAKENLKDKVKALRAVTQVILEENKKISMDPSLLPRTCPLSEEDLLSSAQRFSKKYTEICRKIIVGRKSRQVLLASIELSATPPVKKFLDRFSNLTKEKYDLEFRNADSLDEKLNEVYHASGIFLKKESKELLRKVSSENSNERNMWDNFLGDKKMVQALNRASESPDFEALMCKKNAAYGKGRDYLDNGLMVGSLLLTGGYTGLAALSRAAVRAMKVADVARSSGVLTRSSMASLQVAIGHASASANLATLYTLLDKDCLSEDVDYIKTSPVRSVQSTNEAISCACADESDVREVRKNNCYITGALGVVGFATLFPAGTYNGLKEAGSKISKASLRAAARGKEVLKRYASVLPATIQDSEVVKKVLIDLEKRGWTPSQIKAHLRGGTCK